MSSKSSDVYESATFSYLLIELLVAPLSSTSYYYTIGTFVAGVTGFYLSFSAYFAFHSCIILNSSIYFFSSSSIFALIFSFSSLPSLRSFSSIIVFGFSYKTLGSLSPSTWYVIDLPNLTSFLLFAAFSKSSLVVLSEDFDCSLFLSSYFSSSVFFSKGFDGIVTTFTLLKSKSTLAYGSFDAPAPPIAPPSEPAPN